MSGIADNPPRERRLSLQKSAEAIVPEQSASLIGTCLPAAKRFREGPNAQTQGTSVSLVSGWRQNTRRPARVCLAFVTEEEGEAFWGRIKGLTAFGGRLFRSLAARFVHAWLVLCEPPGADPHAGWCGRRGQ